MAGSALAQPSSPFELAIIGGGPVGLYACYYAGFRGLDTVLLEALPFVGGQIAAFYSDAEIFDIAGHPRIRGRDLTASLEHQARSFGASIRLGCEVVAIVREGEALRLKVRSSQHTQKHREEVLTRSVLLTVGIGALAAQRIGDPAIDRFEGRGLCYDEPARAALQGRRVMVLGGSALARETALSFVESGALVWWVHRRERLVAGAGMPPSHEGSNLVFVPFRELESLEGEDTVRAAVLVDRRSGTRERFEVDLVVPRFGVAARGESLTALGADANATFLVDSRMATSEPGIWAAGDVATYPGKVKVLATAFGEACTAVNNIAHVLIEGATIFPGYSSHRGGVARRHRR